MTCFKIALVLTFILLGSANGSAQEIFTAKPTLSNEDEVSSIVTRELDAVFHSEDFIKKKNKQYPDVKGTMVIDIGIVQNGKVSSFFNADSNIANIDFINFMSDYILQHKFQFKLKKQQRYKVRYTAIFNNDKNHK